MSTSRALAVLVALLASPAGRAADAAPGAAPAAGAEAPRAWSFSASLYGFIVPESRDYVNPNVTADRGGLHLEARYNYEAYEAASAWVGWNFKFGKELTLEITPMLGGVFGSTYGIAPGWLLAVGWRSLSLSSQGEYFIDPSDASGNYLYVWSELDWSPVEWFRTGLAIQRTRAYESPLDVQRGFLVGVSYRSLAFTGYVFNLGWTDPTVVLAVVATF
jgi:hypothetical protein